MPIRKRFRLPVDPYFAAGLFAVLAVGAAVMLRPQVSGARTLPGGVGPIVATLDSLGLGHRYGSPQAPVQVVELFDFECPACAASHRANWADIEKHVAAGVVSYTAYDLVLPSHRSAVPAAVVANCVERSQPERAWAFRTQLFLKQADWAGAYPIEPVLLALAAGVGADTAAARRCVAGTAAEQAARFRAGWEAASARGLTFIPVWTVNGRPVDWPRLDEAIRAAAGEP